MSLHGDAWPPHSGSFRKNKGGEPLRRPFPRRLASGDAGDWSVEGLVAAPEAARGDPFSSQNLVMGGPKGFQVGFFMSTQSARQQLRIASFSGLPSTMLSFLHHKPMFCKCTRVTRVTNLLEV